MCLKIRCDGKSQKFCKIFWELNKAQLGGMLPASCSCSAHTAQHCDKNYRGAAVEQGDHIQGRVRPSGGDFGVVW